MDNGSSSEPEEQRHADAPVPWAQRRASAQQRTTSRVRAMVRGLPDWEPIPPGEIVVRRGRDR